MVRVSLKDYPKHYVVHRREGRDQSSDFEDQCSGRLVRSQLTEVRSERSEVEDQSRVERSKFRLRSKVRG